MQRVSPERIIEMVQNMRPNEANEEMCMFILSGVEFRVLYELYGGDPRYVEEGYMVLGFPYEDVYWTYLLSMIDLMQGNFESYKITRALADEAWERFLRSYDVSKHRKYFNHDTISGGE